MTNDDSITSKQGHEMVDSISRIAEVLPDQPFVSLEQFDRIVSGKEGGVTAEARVVFDAVDSNADAAWSFSEYVNATDSCEAFRSVISFDVGGDQFNRRQQSYFRYVGMVGQRLEDCSLAWGELENGPIPDESEDTYSVNLSDLEGMEEFTDLVARVRLECSQVATHPSQEQQVRFFRSLAELTGLVNREFGNGAKLAVNTRTCE